MAREREMRPLGELTENLDGRRVPVREADRRPGPYPYYGASGVVDHVDGYLFDGEHLLIAEDGENLRSRNTPIAFLARGKFWVNNHAHIVRGNEHADTRYLMYALQVTDIGGYLTGSAMPKLTQGNMNRILVPSPPLEEQRAIAHILGTLDDKIELNRRMNETLEGMARAIFKSWFVDFDPVRAKAEGRDPCLPKHIADLFPDSFEASELGPFPSGWARRPLADFFNVGIGGVWGDEVPDVKSGKAIRCLRGIDCHGLAERTIPSVPVRFVGDKQVEARSLRGGEILIEGSGSFCGRSIYWMTDYEQVFDAPVLYSNFCKRLDPKCTISQSLICWGHLRRAYDLEELSGFRVGTAFPNFDVHGLLANFEVVVPPPELADLYAMFYRSFLRIDLLQQSQVLTSIRDTLLPKLISGEIRVE